MITRDSANSLFCLLGVVGGSETHKSCRGAVLNGLRVVFLRQHFLIQFKKDWIDKDTSAVVVVASVDDLVRESHVGGCGVE